MFIFVKIFNMVRFFTEETDFKFKNKLATRRWLKSVAVSESRKIGDVNVIFCSDNYLLDVNKKYLSHDYFTDIITFDYCFDDTISGDLFISVDSVKDNSSFYHTGFYDEMNRVIVHGLLHLIGYDDHTDDDIKIMRAKEDFYLSIRENFK